MESNNLKKWMLILLPEIFGATDEKYGYILDHGKAGILGTLDQLDASAASRAPKPGGETIASHSGHALYMMELFNAYADGQNPKTDWPGSWKNQTVNEAQWNDLRNRIRSNYEGILKTLEIREDWNEDVVSASLILLGHCAYHLGEIKQMTSSASQQIED